MDSLLANYADDDDDGGQGSAGAPPAPAAPPPLPPSLARKLAAGVNSAPDVNTSGLALWDGRAVPTAALQNFHGGPDAAWRECILLRRRGGGAFPAKCRRRRVAGDPPPLPPSSPLLLLSLSSPEPLRPPLSPSPAHCAMHAHVATTSTPP